MRWPHKYRSLPPLTGADLSEDGWPRREAELKTRGIDVGDYLVHELPRARKRDPELSQSHSASALPKDLVLKGEFYKWAYRSGITGVVSILAIGVMRASGAWRHVEALFFVLGGICLLAIVGLTTYSMVAFSRYVGDRKRQKARRT
jgi:hypothetical protein